MTSPKDLTVLYSVSNLLMTKHIRRDQRTGKLIKSPYGNEKFFKIRIINTGDFPALADTLSKLAAAPHAFVVRGAPLPGIDREKARRLLYAHPETGEPATFTESARHWFAVDLDKIPAPPLTDVATDPEDAIAHLIGLLPPELHDASCWWQFTSSQGLPGAEDRLSARLWFWSCEPLDDAALKRWGLAANKAAGIKVVDTSIYTPVQPHYTAHPVFESGMRDPLPRRHGVRVGLDEIISLVIPSPDPADPETYCAGGFVGLGVEHYLHAIGGAEGFRKPMVAAIASHYAINGATADPGPIKARVREAISNADPGGRAAADITRYCSDQHLDDIVAWVRAQERTRPASGRPSPAELCEAVPIGDERARAVAAVLRQLLRQRHLDPLLSVTLAECFNQSRCSPPLADEQVRAIAHAIAEREIAASQRGGYGG